MGKSLIVFGFLLTSGAFQSWGRAPIYEKVLYGGDGRLDLSEVVDPIWLDAADSTVAFFRSNRILPLPVTQASPEPSVRLVTSSYGGSMGLCEDEPFFEQRKGPTAGRPRGADLVLTAGHCVDDAEDCESTSLVFGWAIHDGMSAQSDIMPASEVYRCKEIVSAEREETGSDWAVIRLDRPVVGHEPLQIARRTEDTESGGIEVGTEVVVIGHPSGLPTKVALDARVRSAVDPRFFTANTDTYGGNSGSPVFNAWTGEIEGVLVRGEDDFELSGEDGCIRSKRCSEEGCHGEDITRVSMASTWIPLF